MVSHTLCSETFVAGLPTEQTFIETLKPIPGINRLAPFVHYEVDRTHREVKATLAGMFESRAAYVDGFGCVLLNGSANAPDWQRPPPSERASDPIEKAPSQAVSPQDRRLRAALDHAFAEPESGPARATKAIVVVHGDRIVAEHYAPGYGIATPLLSWSVAKSVINALIGILVRERKLATDATAPVAAWAQGTDPRHAITVEQLMRMTSGLALDETNKLFDPNSHMLFKELDMAGFAQRAALIAPPGTRWRYSSPTTIILSRIIRDAVGGRAEDVVSFADRELFAPTGMRNVTIEFDATGTPIGAAYMYATARDWARFGMLYMNDGIVGGRRILPEGWVQYSASLTRGAPVGYGAGFFTNRGDSEFGRGRVRGGMPADSFFASGTLGQRIVIAPAQRLVIVRFGRAQDWPEFDARGMVRLVAEVNAAVNGCLKGPC